MQMTISQIIESHRMQNEQQEINCLNCYENLFCHFETAKGGYYLFDCHGGNISISSSSKMEVGIENLKDLEERYGNSFFEIDENEYRDLIVVHQTAQRDLNIDALLAE